MFILFTGVGLNLLDNSINNFKAFTLLSLTPILYKIVSAFVDKYSNFFKTKVLCLEYKPFFKCLYIVCLESPVCSLTVSNLGNTAFSLM